METKAPVVEHWAHTHSKLHNLNFTWSLDHYSFLQKNNGQFLLSPKFPLDANDGISWNVKLYPKGLDEKSKDSVSIFLNLISDCNTRLEVLAKFNISILNDQPLRTMTCKSTETENFVLQNGWGFSKFIERAFLLDESNGYLTDDKLTIFCKVSYIFDTIDVCTQKNIKRFKIPDCKVTIDLGNLLESRKFSDITLVAGEDEFPVHRAILAARSDVFAAMFDHDLEESKSGRVEISDINKEVLEEMLHFIYTGKAPKLKEMAIYLLSAADKYALHKLKAMTEEALFDKLSIETAAEILVLADLHSADQLKEHTMHFIKSHAGEIVKTKGWTDMLKANVHSALIAEALEAFFSSPSQGKYELPTT